MKRIYLDYAATTPVDKKILNKIKKYAKNYYGNPSSQHYDGKKSKVAMEKARKQCADFLNCDPSEIFFTSGASESNSLVVNLYKVLASRRYNHDSMFDYNKEERLYNNYELLSIPLVDSLTGEIFNPMSTNINLHLDLTQAVKKIDINLNNWDNVKTASLSSHKFGGLKGCGLLYIQKSFQRENNNNKRIINGHQEQELRGGTENLLGIIIMGELLSKININKSSEKIIEYRNMIINFCKDNNIFCKSLNNSGIINIQFNNISSHTAVCLFDNCGISISAGSACNSNNEEIIPQIYKENFSIPENVIRVSFSDNNTKKDICRFCKILKKIVDTYDNM